MYRLVEGYSTETIDVRGYTFPIPSLVEDEDGIRLLLVTTVEFPATLWARAHANGAQAIVWADAVVPEMAYVLSPTVFEHRTEIGDQFRIEIPLWKIMPDPLSYTDMVLQLEKSAVESSDSDNENLSGFVNLHCHSEFSALDGMSKLEEMAIAAKELGQTALSMTDHGTCAGHPSLQKMCDKYGLRPIFGIEAYFVHDRHDRTDKDYYHLVLWALDDNGLRNLWAMSTESYRDGFYGKPRMDWATLERFAEGVAVSTACLRGPLAHEYLEKNDEEMALANLLRLKEIFDGRLYIELHVNQLAQQIRVNRWLVDVAERYEVPLLAAVDSHYARLSEKDAHQVWLSVQTNKDVADDTTLFAGGQDYHMMGEGEVRKALSYLPDGIVDESILNTAILASRCVAKIVPNPRNPIYSRLSDQYPDRVQRDIDLLLDICLARWDERIAGKPYTQDEAMARFEHETGRLIRKGFCGYFLIVWDLVRFAKTNGILVGPGRGSGGGSFVAYLLGIIELDPIEHDLLFERFMTEGRTELPDFDLDFPSAKKHVMYHYAAERWGEGNVATVGTHMRLQNKAAIKDTARAIQSRLPETIWRDADFISDLITGAEASTAGLGLSWEDLWIQIGELLEPFREKYPELFELAGIFKERLRGYGKHPAGIIIDTDHPLIDALPLRGGEDGQGMIAQFDLDALAELGFVKFDLLNVANLDTIQACVDLIEEQTGRRINPYSWREEYRDPFIWDQLGEGWTLGVFQVGTSTGTREVKQFKPRSIAELADVITLVRPGPKNSGLTATYHRRRDGEEEVTFQDPRLESLLAKSYGTMLYQEDVLNVCMTIAGYDDIEADAVRKILGKKKVEAVQEAGEKFIAAAVANSTERSVAESLWAQMAEYAKYGFGKAHAIGYALLGHWTAWFKFHYPVQFLCSALTTIPDSKKTQRTPEFVEEARRMGYQVLPPDINDSGTGFTAFPMAVRYGLLSVRGIGEAAAAAIMSNRPYTSWEDFLDRRGSKCNSGHVATLVRIGAFDTLESNRRALEARLQYDAIPGSDKCRWKDSDYTNDYDLPCRFDWESEPPPVGRTGKPLKKKAPPKRCTKGCRQYAPIDPPDPETIEPYTDADIRDIEVQQLGVYLSSTPFDRIPAEDREELATAQDVQVGPLGSYTLAAIIRSVRTRRDRYEREMAFLTLTTERGELDCVVFSSVWERVTKHVRPGALAFTVVEKNSRGTSLDELVNVDE